MFTIVLGGFSVLKINKFNPAERFATFSGIADLIDEKINLYGQENIDFTMNIVNPYYLDYYLRFKKLDVNFATTSNKGFIQLIEFREIVKNSNKKYFLYTWTNSDNPLEILPIIKEKFPCLIERKFMFNSEFYLFSKQNNCKDTIQKLRFISVNNFENQLPYWTFNKNLLANNESERKGQLLKKENEYSSAFEAPLNEIINQIDDIIFASVSFKAYQKNTEAGLCVSVSENDKQIYWSSIPLRAFIDSIGTTSIAYHGIRIPEITTSSAKVKIYVMNPKPGSELLLENIKVEVFDGNANLYGKRPKLSLLPK